ncbi:TonB-dependent receptor [Methylomonas sp. AM2-LC]|uniref:TonB-dependent siderophore receptor n=1 Tax=Methylomonas sp. AM2-LC TaxID=3153301 RepID=UPI0032640640
MPQLFALKTTRSQTLAVAIITFFLIQHSLSATAEGVNKQTFNIPAQPLQSAINQLSEEADLQISYPAELVKGMTVQSLSGHFTVKEALDKLLSGTGLTSRLTPNNAITIEKVDNPNGQSDSSGLLEQKLTTLPKVTVVGNSIYDVKDPYNQDYVLPTATSGTKTDTPIMETPLNVQVVSKQVLKDQQVITVADALQNVSGVTVNSASYNAAAAGTSQALFFRGFASETFFRDGFRLQQGSATREMSNIESVEVMKGPAAILYGMVEPGGMVNVITKQPLATPYYALNQQFGSFSNYRTTVDATGPLTKDDTLLYRMNMSYQDSGSFIQFQNKQDVFIAPVLKWNISPRTQATFELEYNYQNLGLAVSRVPRFGTTFDSNGNIISPGQLFPIPRSVNYGEYSPGSVENIFGGFNWSHQFNDNWSLKHRFSVNQQNQNINSLIMPISATATDVSRQYMGNTWDNNTYANSLDLTGHFNTFGLHHTLLMGGDYYRINSGNAFRVDNSPQTTISIFNPVHSMAGISVSNLTPYTTTTTQTDQFGFYIQDQIKLPYHVHVMGGIRYQNIHQNQSNEYGSYLKSFGQSIGCSSCFQDTKTAQSQDAVTPRVGILWQPQSWLSLYANYVESFGANQGIMFPGKAVPPTSANQYEGGIKTEFYEGRLRANLAYFDLTKTNIITTDPNYPNGPFVLAVGAAQSRGFEFDMTGEIVPGWNAIATYSYTDARITKSNNDGTNAFSPTGSVDPVGTRMFGVPRNTARLWNTYEIQQGDLLGLKFGGGVTVRDGQTGCCYQPSITIPGYATLDIMTSYHFKVGKSKLTAQLNVNNLLNKYYYTGIYTNFTGVDAVDFGTPRSFMGSIGIQF